jgi:hypothetical protein
MKSRSIGGVAAVDAAALAALAAAAVADVVGWAAGVAFAAGYDPLALCDAAALAADAIEEDFDVTFSSSCPEPGDAAGAALGEAGGGASNSSSNESDVL